MDNTNAPGKPGNKAKWTSSKKSGIGKAINAVSEVAFTLGDGIINEVYFPREDTACLRDMEFLVTDGTDFFSEEKRDTDHQVKMIEDEIPAYQVTNTCIQKKYQIQKEIITDPLRNSVLQKVSFKSVKESAYYLYALINPHMNNQGDSNSGWIETYKGMPMLFAKAGGLYLAVACTAKWLKRSVGFIGVSDGCTDLHEHKTMTWEYSNADCGNIALTGEINISETQDFVLALSFGRKPSEAASHARGSILDGFSSAKNRYMERWKEWLQSLLNVKGRYFKISAAVLRLNEAKTFPGGIIASMSLPWGEVKGDQDLSGYHLVWPRDLVESAGGFLALQTKDDTFRILNFLMSAQEEDGHWPQNLWLPGNACLKGIQMDQTALPLLLIHNCDKHGAIGKEKSTRYWPLIKKAISYLIKNGPYTQLDRWEAEKGLTPFTIAAEIAALLVAADFADENQEPEIANYCRETADCWNDQIESWIYVTNSTSLAEEANVDGYYIRINPYYSIPASELGSRYIDLKNHKGGDGRTLLNELVSVDALALVRFGLRAADDPKILNTLKVIDAKLKVETPFGPCWHRFNNDGYGEHKNGDPFDGTGIGRAWPLLTGERGHYEIAAGNIEEATRLIKTMEAFTNNGLLPEQIWDTDDIPEKDLFIGRPSGSAMPLTWAHSEYIKLCASIQNKKVFDMPLQTQERYIKQKKTSQYQIWRFEYPCSIISLDKKLRIEVMANAVIRWSDDGWQTTKETLTKDTGLGLFIGDIPIENENCKDIVFTFFWTEAKQWENKNFTVKIKGG